MLDQTPGEFLTLNVIPWLASLFDDRVTMGDLLVYGIVGLCLLAMIPAIEISAGRETSAGRYVILAALVALVSVPISTLLRGTYWEFFMDFLLPFALSLVLIACIVHVTRRKGPIDNADSEPDEGD